MTTITAINGYGVLFTEWPWTAILMAMLPSSHSTAQGHLGVNLASSPLTAWLWNRTPVCGWSPALCPLGKETRRSVCACVRALWDAHVCLVVCMSSWLGFPHWCVSTPYIPFFPSLEESILFAVNTNATQSVPVQPYGMVTLTPVDLINSTSSSVPPSIEQILSLRVKATTEFKQTADNATGLETCGLIVINRQQEIVAAMGFRRWVINLPKLHAYLYLQSTSLELTWTTKALFVIFGYTSNFNFNKPM